MCFNQLSLNARNNIWRSARCHSAIYTHTHTRTKRRRSDNKTIRFIIIIGSIATHTKNRRPIAIKYVKTKQKTLHTTTTTITRKKTRVYHDVVRWLLAATADFQVFWFHLLRIYKHMYNAFVCVRGCMCACLYERQTAYYIRKQILARAALLILRFFFFFSFLR